MEKFSRRAAVQIALAFWGQAQDHAHTTAPTTAVPFTFRFFTAVEAATVRRFAAVLIPGTPRSGGAAAARVEEYIDHVLSAAAPSLQRIWRRGLSAWSKAKDPRQVFDQAAPAEFDPRSAGERFFVLFKSAATAAFYTSEEGIQRELGYQGMAFLREYKGWEGEEFRRPADYRPLLRARG